MDTDDPDKHRRDIITLHMMRREYEVFDSFQKQIFEFDALVTTYSCNSVDKDVKTKKSILGQGRRARDIDGKTTRENSYHFLSFCDIIFALRVLHMKR